MSEWRAAEPGGRSGACGSWRPVSGIFRLASVDAGEHKETFRRHLGD